MYKVNVCRREILSIIETELTQGQERGKGQSRTGQTSFWELPDTSFPVVISLTSLGYLYRIYATAVRAIRTAILVITQLS